MSIPYGSGYVFRAGLQLVNGELLLRFGDTLIAYKSLPLGLQQAVSAAAGVAMSPLVLGSAVVALLLNSMYQGDKRKEAESRAKAAQEKAEKAQQRAEEANQREKQAQEREEEAQQREQEAREELERYVQKSSWSKVEV